MARPAISAHRGGSESAAPATWESYRDAVTTGAEYVELDIRRLRDGTLVVYHDPRANHTGPLLADLTYRDFCAAAGYEVPTVAGVCDLLAGRAIAHLDLKEIGYEADVVKLALDRLGAGQFVATTLEDPSVAAIKRGFPEVRTALSLGRSLAEIRAWRRLPSRLADLFAYRRVRACGADWVAAHHRLARFTVLRMCARRGVGAMVWTVNQDPALRSFLDDPRVDVLITDRPRRALALRQR